MVGLAGLTVMLDIVVPVTVRLALALTLPMVAVMLALPVLWPVARPVKSTDAMVLLELSQITQSDISAQELSL